jgi:hypothetical protein
MTSVNRNRAEWGLIFILAVFFAGAVGLEVYLAAQPTPSGNVAYLVALVAFGLWILVASLINPGWWANFAQIDNSGRHEEEVEEEKSEESEP